jgi:hypothetical protein
MGYHLTILRTVNGRREPLSEAELEAAVASVPEARLIRDERDRPQVDLLVDGTVTTSLYWQDGELWTKNVEDPALALMIRLASLLNGRVRGDEFETYRTPTDYYYHPDDEPERAEAAKETQVLKRRVQEERERAALRKFKWAGAFVLVILVFKLVEAILRSQ